MAGATIAPSLPQMSTVFASHPGGEFLSKLILTVPAFCIAIGAPIAGIIIDKIGRKKLLLTALLLYAAGGTSGLYLSSPYSVLAGRAVLGFAVAAAMTTVTTLVSDYFEGQERNQYMGWQSASIALGGVVFVGLGGLLADVSWRTPFAIYFVSLLYFPIALIYIVEPEKPVRSSPSCSVSSYRIQWPTLMLVYGTSFLFMLIFYMGPVQIPFLVSSMGAGKGSASGIVLMTMSATAALASLTYRRIRAKLPFTGIYAISFFIMGAGFFIVFKSDQIFEMCAGMAVAGLGIGAMMPNASLWVMRLSPPGFRGRLVGILSTSLFLGQFLSPIAVQPFSRNATLHVAFVAASVVLFFLGAFFTVAVAAGWFKRV